MCKRSLAIPGFGPLVSQAIKNWMGDGKQFRRGRDASAALGLVPRLFSTGGKQVLLGITKCGDQYVRSMLIYGARAVLFRASEKTDSLSVWVNRIREKRGFNRAVVALANKLLRIARVIIARNEMYLPATKPISYVKSIEVKLTLKLRRMQNDEKQVRPAFRKPAR